MAKDLVIGAASNYDWNHLKYWVNSIKKTGFKGDIVIVATNMSGETLNKLIEQNVKVFAYGKRSEDGGIHKSENNIPPHVERFLFIWDFLRKHKEQESYRYVTVTDTRDVIFQKNPVEYLQNHLVCRSTIVASSEGLKYKDEPWGCRNFQETFGPMVFEEYKDELIYNVGVIAGYADDVKDLMIEIFFQSINRPIPIVDQAVFNFLIKLESHSSINKIGNMGGWAIQLGTSLLAIESGAGDIGLVCRNDPSKLEEYKRSYQDTQPLVEGNLVTNGKVPFHIVHQWDRVPQIKDMVERIYG